MMHIHGHPESWGTTRHLCDRHPVLAHLLFTFPRLPPVRFVETRIWSGPSPAQKPLRIFSLNLQWFKRLSNWTQTTFPVLFWPIPSMRPTFIPATQNCSPFPNSITLFCTSVWAMCLSLHPHPSSLPLLEKPWALTSLIHTLPPVGFLLGALLNHCFFARIFPHQTRWSASDPLPVLSIKWCNAHSRCPMLALSQYFANGSLRPFQLFLWLMAWRQY